MSFQQIVANLFGLVIMIAVWVGIIACAVVFWPFVLAFFAFMFVAGIVYNVLNPTP